MILSLSGELVRKEIKSWSRTSPRAASGPNASHSTNELNMNNVQQWSGRFVAAYLDDGGAIYSAWLRTDGDILQMMGSAAQHNEAIPQKPWGPNRENSQPETIVNSAVVPPIATVP